MLDDIEDIIQRNFVWRMSREVCTAACVAHSTGPRQQDISSRVIRMEEKANVDVQLRAPSP